MRYLKPYWWAALLAPLTMVLEVMMDLQMPTMMSQIVDVGIANGDNAYILSMGIRMLLYALLGAVGGFASAVFGTIASANYANDLRRDVFHHVQRFTFQNLDTFKTGSLITRLTNDVTQMQNMIGTILRMLVRSPLLCIGGIVMAIALNRQMAVIFIAAIPILIVAIALILRRGFPLFRKAQESMDKVNTVMQENLTGVRVVKAFVRADFEKGRFDGANVGLREINQKAMRNMSLLFPILNLTMNLSVIAVLWLGGELIDTGGMEIGKLMAFINYLTQILMSLMMSAFTLMGVSRAKASADRINAVLGETPEIDDPANPVPISGVRGAVSFEHVTARYAGQGGEPVLQDVSFSVEPGETLAILGATGAGKTTLISLIPRLYDPTAGEVKLDGVNVRDYRLEDLRSAVSVVLQQSVLFSGSVEENLRWGDEGAAMDALADAARAAQAYDFVDAMPEGFTTQIGRAGVNLSGGQKQRLSIARSLVRRPKVLILDDATSAVDMSTEAMIQEALRAQRCTVIIIAQRISSVMDADRILVLEDGKVSAIGSHEELLKSSGLYREICASQLGKEAV